MINRFLKFIKVEGSVGILLFAFALLAIIVDNSALHSYYQKFFDTQFIVSFGTYKLSKPFLLWINEGFMVIFFMLIGLEIKREMFVGELNTWHKLALPGFAALGGMVVPAVIYVALNWGDLQAIRGWAVPSATDIAFSLGILTLLGSRIPNSLKVFLTALAILDDLGAILIITLFYTTHISLLLLTCAALCLLVLFLLNRYQVQKLMPYLIVGVLLWGFVLESGVHATLAGVALAFAIPLQDQKNPRYSLLRRLEGALHPWVAYLILPLFAFANAGVSFAELSVANLFTPVSLGIVCGLFIGKQVGVFGASWLAIRLGWAKLPYNINWIGLYGVAILCGIGFTMSLFIGTLAFQEIDTLYGVSLRLGVLTASILSAVVGYAILYFNCYHTHTLETK